MNKSNKKKLDWLKSSRGDCPFLINNQDQEDLAEVKVVIGKLFNIPTLTFPQCFLLKILLIIPTIFLSTDYPLEAQPDLDQPL